MSNKVSKKEIFFGAGCFWGVEENFRNKYGVLETEVGYCGGNKDNPTYEDVCTKDTGHAEVVRIVYDENKVSSEEIIKFFFKIHDPTTLNRQGPDIGSQYRSVIFYKNEEQRLVSESIIKDLNKDVLPRKIVTIVEKFNNYYKAENYHQKYLMKRDLKTCY